MEQPRQPPISTRDVRKAAEQGDYARAAVLASVLLPGMEQPLARFRDEMEAYERARLTANWHRALRSLADARAAAMATGLFELETVVTHRLFDVVKLQHEGRG